MSLRSSALSSSEEVRAGMNELGVGDLQQVERFRIEIEAGALVIERCNASEEAGVEYDHVAVGCELGRENGFELLQRGVGVGSGDA